MRNAPPDVSERLKFAEGEGKSKKTFAGIGANDSIRHLFSEFTSRKSLTQEARENEEENHRIYSGLNYGQIPKEILAEIKEKGLKKEIAQFNFVQKKVDGVVGDFIQNGLDFDYLSTDGDNTDTLSVIKDLYFFDKELCDWETELMVHYTNGCIKSSWMQMTVDYRHDNNFGNIGLKTMVPASVLPDPNWVSNNSGDCKNLFTSTYMKLDDVKRTWKKSAKQIQRMIDTRRLADASNEGLHQGSSIPRFNLNESYNDTIQVIQYHTMQTETRTQRMGITKYQSYVVIPEDADENWYTENAVIPDKFIESDINVDIYKIVTFIPELSMTEAIEDKPGLLQIGRLPFFHWAYKHHNGENIGMVDQLKDPQQYFNSMIGLAKEIIANSKHVTVIDPGIVDSNVTSLEELEEKFSQPGSKIIGAEGFSLEYPNAIQTSNSSAYAGNELEFANSVLALSDRLTPQSATMEGGGSERSGILFEYKREQGEVSKTLLKEGRRRFLNELAEAYFYSCQSLYGGMYRKFETAGGTVEINKPLPDGRILNDITTVARAKIIISDSPEGTSRRINDKLIGMEMFSTLGNTDPMMATYAIEAIFNGMDNMPKSKRAEMSEDLAKRRELLRTNQAAQITNAQLSLVSGKQQIEQMMNPQPPAMPPQEGAEGEQPQQPQEQQELVEPIPKQQI